MKEKLKNILFVVGVSLYAAGLMLAAIYLVSGGANLLYKLFGGD